MDKRITTKIELNQKEGRLANVGQSTLVIALKIESKPFALRLQGRSIERPYSAGMTSCVPIERLLLSFLRKQESTNNPTSQVHSRATD